MKEIAVTLYLDERDFAFLNEHAQENGHQDAIDYLSWLATVAIQDERYGHDCYLEHLDEEYFS